MANDWASLACFVLCNLSAGRELVFPGILEYSQNKKTSKVKRKQRVTAPNRFSSGPIITVFNIRSETWSNQSKKQSYEDFFVVAFICSRQIDQFFQGFFPVGVGKLRFPNTMKSLCPSLLFGNSGLHLQMGFNHTIPGWRCVESDVDVLAG